MRYLYILLFLCFACTPGYSQAVTLRPLVVQTPAMQKVIIKENREYLRVNDTSLKFDLYYPPAFKSDKKLPLVIFNNGVGSMDLLKWRVYQDWGRLVAANDMIAVNYQSRNGHTLEEGAALIDYLVSHADELNIDKDKIGIWTCSGNARIGMRLAHKSRPGSIKALVVYYGGPDSLGQLRQDLPTLLVRAGLDGQGINMGMENFIQASLQHDTRIEVINYLEGIHAFDIYNNTDESKAIIWKTVEFLKKNLTNPVTQKDFILTNRNFMWLVMSGQLPKAIEEFRKARIKYRADSNFHPFYNAVIREDVLNTNAYWLMDQDHKADALEVFKLVVESYPESPNAYESLSEAYEKTGNKNEAVRNAEITLQKLQTVTGVSDAFKRTIRESAEERLKRLK